MKSSSSTISGLDIQKEYISVAQYSAIENSVPLVAIQPLNSIQSDSDIFESAGLGLKELKGKFKFTNRDLVCSLPSEYAILKRITVDADEPDLEECIEWELSQQVIGSIDEYSFDFQPLSSTDPDSKEYLVAAYRNENVHRISSIIKNLKLNVVVVDLDLFALINVFEINYREKASAPTVILHGESEKSKLILTQNGMPVDFENFEYAYGIDVNGYTDTVLDRYERFLAFNKNTVREGPVEVYLTGSIFSNQDYAEALVSKLGTAEMLDPFRKIICRIGASEEQLKTYASQLSVAVGLALRGKD